MGQLEDYFLFGVPSTVSLHTLLTEEEEEEEELAVSDGDEVWRGSEDRVLRRKARSIMNSQEFRVDWAQSQTPLRRDKRVPVPDSAGEGDGSDDDGERAVDPDSTDDEVRGNDVGSSSPPPRTETPPEYLGFNDPLFWSQWHLVLLPFPFPLPSFGVTLAPAHSIVVFLD